MFILLFVAGVLLGFVALVAAFLIITPIHAAGGLYVNRPTATGPSGFHLFTRLGPGQVKIIERNEKVVRMISDTPNKKFARKGDRNSPEYWEFVNSNAPEDPVADVWLPLRWWARLVYKYTGLVFTGIYPFQKVREYKLERTALRRTEDTTKAHRTDSNLILEVKEDWSDHFRTRQFLFPMHVTAAETKDKIPLDIIGVGEMHTVNAYKAAYGTDRWDQAVTNLATDKLNEKTRLLDLDWALTADDAARAQQIADSVKSISDDTKNNGIEITAFRILEINPVLDAEGMKTIQSEALAKQKAKATRIDGEARADALKKLNEANQAGGDYAIETMQAEAFVRAAEAASKGGGTVILSSPGGREAANDTVQKAMLAEIKKLTKKGAS